MRSPRDPAARLETRDLFSKCAATVNLITCPQGGVATGMTATSVCSLSLDPPSALICVNREARTRDAIVRAGTFVINVLERAQDDIANHFSRPGSDKAIPAGLLSRDPRLAADLAEFPVLAGAAGALMCRLERVVDFGSHSIMIGLVDRVVGGPAGAEPLVYHDRKYVATLAEHLLPAAAEKGMLSALGW
ncbi:FMN reductase (NADH) RutF [Acrocarpospora phusangensis]|uniref:FMN reductase (NADH) RutF n=1 Tax=Acrocarpospora phusangensis TaxID=1070424 RepID=A0A919UMJ2_9ACTN|nr:flavin reductase family protein [Acrocarpospora phusangensis]GIH23402.1 FMN reductase (NADH) RutF [Acrocarpospora phusangensis]